MTVKNKHIPKKRTPAKKVTAIVTDTVGSYEKHPFFIKKAAAAKALLLNVGLPKRASKKTTA